MTTPCCSRASIKRQGVHHRAQHAHVIRGGLVHAHFQADLAAPQVAGADDDGNIHAQFAHFLDAAGDLQRLGGVNAAVRWCPARDSPPSLSKMR